MARKNATKEATSTAPVHGLGIGIDTARYGHHVSFLRDDKQQAAKPLMIAESCDGYQRLEDEIRKLHQKYPQAIIRLRIDAAGQYAANLESFIRAIDLPISVSVGEPKRNKDYHRAHSPKRKSDASESLAMARFAVVEQPDASYARPPQFNELRRVASRLMAQVKQTTRLNNQLHETLSSAFPEFAVIVADLKKEWVLTLLEKYPTAACMAAGKLDTMKKIRFIDPERVTKIYEAAKQSVASLSGTVSKQLIAMLVKELRHSMEQEEIWKTLLIQAFVSIPEGPHRQVVTIGGIGQMTAAAIVATAVDIRRFETAKQFIGYYGVFPEEFQSGVDRSGNPHPPGKKHMCPRGNDLVRALLWNCAKSASGKNSNNPAVRALYLRMLASGKSSQVAWGYCMHKLLNQIFGVWTSNTAFNPNFERTTPRPDLNECAASGSETDDASAADDINEMTDVMPDETWNQETAGHNEHGSEVKEVTAAPGPLEPVNAAASPIDSAEPVQTPASGAPAASASNPSESRPASRRTASTISSTENHQSTSLASRINFEKLRRRISMRDILATLNFPSSALKREQYRCQCPLHTSGLRLPPDNTKPENSTERTLSINMTRGIFQCFHATCRQQGNAIDFWAAWHQMDIYTAAIHLAATFKIPISEIQ